MFVYMNLDKIALFPVLKKWLYVEALVVCARWFWQAGRS